jgi:hypothetical protein
MTTKQLALAILFDFGDSTTRAIEWCRRTARTHPNFAAEYNDAAQYLQRLKEKREQALRSPA